jgi:hypothetical protein
MRSILFKLVLVSAGMAASLATTAAMAETRLTVPFNFTIGSKACPAGIYTVARDPISYAVTMRSLDGKDSFRWTLGPGDPAPSDNRIVLRFADTGQQHTLQSIQFRSLITARLDKNSEHNEHMSMVAARLQ